MHFEVPGGEDMPLFNPTNIRREWERITFPMMLFFSSDNKTVSNHNITSQFNTTKQSEICQVQIVRKIYKKKYDL